VEGHLGNPVVSSPCHAETSDRSAHHWDTRGRCRRGQGCTRSLFSWGITTCCYAQPRDERSSRSATSNPPGSDPSVEQERGALALGSGVTWYVPFGGLFAIAATTRIRFVAAPAGLGGVCAFTRCRAVEAGIWSPAGETIDATRFRPTS